ncbi:MAG: hypothetical protein ACRDGO_08885, partial [Actinomycetota bacterium]
VVGSDRVHEQHMPANLPGPGAERGPGPAVEAGDVPDSVALADGVAVPERLFLALTSWDGR